MSNANHRPKNDTCFKSRKGQNTTVNESRFNFKALKDKNYLYVSPHVDLIKQDILLRAKMWISLSDKCFNCKTHGCHKSHRFKVGN